MKQTKSDISFKLLLAILFLWPACHIKAQEFTVRSFRMLPYDITAYIDPVRDLNDEVCALLKVVGDKDFAFSSPLGVVKRKNDVGEIWLYLPQGSIMLTIKHPQWGVMRDYRFPQALESRMTYELVLTPPLGYRYPIEMPELENKPSLPDTTYHRPESLPHSNPPRIRRPLERWHRLALLNAGIHADGPSIGLRLGVMRRHGAYLLVQKDFQTMPDTQGECDRNGVPAGSDGTPYYTGRTEEGRWMTMAGGIHRIVDKLCLYEGIGYGRHDIAWEQNNGTLLRNKDYSSRGICAEAGCIYRFSHTAISAGVMTIQGKYWEASIGFGIHF